MQIIVDADACPVKNEVFRVAGRYGLKVILVSNTWMRVPKEDWIELVLVGNDRLDQADDWIADKADENTIVVSSDIPLASRCLERGAVVLNSKGRIFDDQSIGQALAGRELSAYLRETGMKTGGPAPFDKKDRSNFLQNLDTLIQAVMKRSGVS